MYLPKIQLYEPSNTTGWAPNATVFDPDPTVYATEFAPNTNVSPTTNKVYLHFSVFARNKPVFAKIRNVHAKKYKNIFPKYNCICLYSSIFA